METNLKKAITAEELWLALLSSLSGRSLTTQEHDDLKLALETTEEEIIGRHLDDERLREQARRDW